MRRFEARRAILEAAEAELSPEQFRQLRRVLLLRPFAARNAVDLVEGACKAQGAVTEDGEIAAAADWAQILQIVLELLPYILKLFGIG